MLVRDEVGPAVAHAGHEAQHEGIDQVVDVQRMVERPAVAEHGEGAARHALEDHEEALGVAGTVDRRGPQDHRLHPAAGELRHERLGLVLGALVVVGRLDRRVFVGGRVLHVAVHAAGAAIDELPNAGLEGGLQHDAGALDVDLVVEGVGHVELAKSRREMEHELDPSHALLHHLTVGHRPEDDLGAHRPQGIALESVLVVQGHDLVPRRAKAPDQRRAGEARTSGDQNPHAHSLLVAPTIRDALFPLRVPNLV